MTTSTELTTKNVTDIINWYGLTGTGNWGSWTNYPTLPSGASYNSFDTCHLRITFDNQLRFKGETFNCIADSRNVPGKNLEVIQIKSLVELCKNDGVEFENEFVTKEKAKEIKENQISDVEDTVLRFEKMATYEWHEPKVREDIICTLNNVIVTKEHGKPLPESIKDYNLTIKNYAGEKEVIFTINLSLTGKNSKGKAGYYKADSVDIEDAVKLFTEEKVNSYSKNLARHRKTLSDLKKSFS